MTEKRAAFPAGLVRQLGFALAVVLAFLGGTY